LMRDGPERILNQEKERGPKEDLPQGKRGRISRGRESLFMKETGVKEKRILSNIKE